VCSSDLANTITAIAVKIKRPNMIAPCSLPIILHRPYHTRAGRHRPATIS